MFAGSAHYKRGSFDLQQAGDAPKFEPMLITLEGIDGSGKTTQALLLEERLRAEGYPVILLREPGGTTLSEHVRSLLLDPSLDIAPFAELLLFSAARTQLVVEKIVPALAAGVVVVCDRFFDSTTAYQGGGRGLIDLDWLRGFHLQVTGGVVPDRTYLIALDPEEAYHRRAARLEQEPGESVEDRMEASGMPFQQDVASAYERLVDEEPSRILRLDGRLPTQQIHDQIWKDARAIIAAGGETSPLRPGSPS